MTTTEKENPQPNPLLEGMMNRRTVILNGEITQENVAQVGQQLLVLQMRSPDRVNLIIDSGGGSITAALRLCDLITTVMTAPVRGIALGSCASAATFVMLYCQERISTPYSQFLIHSGTRSKISIPINQTSSEKLELLLKDVKATEEMVLRLYMNKLTPKVWARKRPTDKEQRTFVQRLINRGDQPFDEWLTAEEAVEIGLIERIIHERLDIFTE